MAVSGLLLGGLQLLAGIFLTATGIGGPIGLKLILSGALSLLSQALAGKARKGVSSSPRYGFDNARNITVQGMPIPIIYGEEVVAPPMISNLVRVEGSASVLYMLFAVCQGEIDSISDVKVNGVPLKSFVGAYRMVKRGTATQSATWLKGGGDDGVGGDIVASGFGSIGYTYTGGTRIEAKTAPTPNGSHIHEMKGSADELWVQLRWPGGLRHQNNDASTGASTWYGRVYVKAYGAADSTYKEYLIPKDASGLRRIGDFAEGKFGAWSTTANTSADLRRLFPVKFAAKGRYTVKIEGLSIDDANDTRVPTVALLTEVTNETRAYEGVALLAIRCPATEQLAGSIPTVTCKVKGKKVLDFRTGVTAWSRNPALCLADLLTNSTYGLGDRIFADDLDTGAITYDAGSRVVAGTWRAFADRCDAEVTSPGRPAEARYQLDLVIDTASDASEWVDAILSTCLASLSDVQGLFRLWEDGPIVGDPAADFDDSPATVRSTRHAVRRDPKFGSSLSVRLIGESDRPNRVIVKHVDRDRDHQNTTTEVRDWRLDVVALTGATQAAGAQVKGGTSGAVGYLAVSMRSGDPFVALVQETDATAFVTGEVLTIGATGSTSTCTTSSAPYRATPERLATLRLIGVTRTSQAQRLARTLVNGAARRSLFASWGIWLGEAKLSPGDVVTYTSSRLGWSSKRFGVLEVSLDFDGSGTVLAREYDADAFAVVDRKTIGAPLNPGGAVPPGTREPTAGSSPAPPASGSSSSAGTGSSTGTGAPSAATGSAGTPTAKTGVGNGRSSSGRKK